MTTGALSLSDYETGCDSDWSCLDELPEMRTAWTPPGCSRDSSQFEFGCTISKRLDTSSCALLAHPSGLLESGHLLSHQRSLLANIFLHPQSGKGITLNLSHALTA
jgi:hypothetical protein